jgi:putative glutamine amidotransferase
MHTIATWIRACDEKWFASAFATHTLRLRDARVENFDDGECDALLLTGGADIAAEFLKQEIVDTSLIENPVPKRDEWEFAALRRALDSGKPVLTICKGTQLLNVALGGTLHLDIPGHNLRSQKDANVQPLRFAARPSFRFEKVNSSHHQAIDKLGGGLEVEAWHAGDGIVEQVRLRGHPFCVGTQFHPERDADFYAPLFAAFVASIPVKK